MKKNCIFHLPWKLAVESNVASEIRPRKILKALEVIGYSVDIVWGNSKERKKSINKIKNRIDEGVKYDFLYSESSTLPTLLTGKHHLPLNPALDFNFFNFCKKNDIPIGLFYRDIYWRFTEIKRFGVLKHVYSKIFHLYDIIKYKKLIDVLFLPNLKMAKYIPMRNVKFQIEQLSPGTDVFSLTKVNNSIFSFLYVGGINPDCYNLSLVFNEFFKQTQIRLIINCRKAERYHLEKYCKKFLSENINVYHYNSDEIYKIYKEADIALLYIEPSNYRQFAMPMKMFEYISFELPILASKNTAVGDFIEENKIGFTIEYNEKALKEFMNNLPNKDELQIIKQNIKKCKMANTWESRAAQIANSLMEFRK